MALSVPFWRHGDNAMQFTHLVRSWIGEGWLVSLAGIKIINYDHWWASSIILAALLILGRGSQLLFWSFYYYFDLSCWTVFNRFSVMATAFFSRRRDVLGAVGCWVILMMMMIPTPPYLTHDISNCFQQTVKVTFSSRAWAGWLVRCSCW